MTEIFFYDVHVCPGLYRCFGRCYVEFEDVLADHRGFVVEYRFGFSGAFRVIDDMTVAVYHSVPERQGRDYGVSSGLPVDAESHRNFVVASRIDDAVVAERFGRDPGRRRYRDMEFQRFAGLSVRGFGLEGNGEQTGFLRRDGDPCVGSCQRHPLSGRPDRVVVQGDRCGSLPDECRELETSVYAFLRNGERYGYRLSDLAVRLLRRDRQCRCRGYGPVFG